MNSRPTHWLNSISMRDPIKRRMAMIVQTMLISLSVTTILGSLLWLLSERSLENSLRPMLLSLLIVLFMVAALAILRSGRLETSVLLATSGLLLALGLDYIGLGTQAGATILIAFMLPIALAGFLTTRSGLLFTIGLGMALIMGTAILEQYAPSMTGFAAPNGLSPSATIICFALVAGLLGLFIDQFVLALRKALAESLAREQELEGIRISLEARTDELSSAKEALENELIVRQQAEAELAYERDLLHALMDNVPDTIYFKDVDSHFTRINRAQAQFLGISDPHEAVGKTDFDFQASELARGFYDEERKIVESGLPLIDRIEFNPTADGRPRWLSSTKMPLKSKDGQVIGIVGVSHDITARQEIDHLKNEFIATVSHELRTPLTSIRGSLGLLSGGVAGDVAPAVKAMIDIAYKNSERLMRLVDDILDIEKIESGKLVFQLAPIDLEVLVQHAIEVNHGYGQQYQVTFLLTQRAPRAMVYSDSDRLMQVLTNLLSNAAKFAPAYSTVEVGVSRHQQALRVSIADHGPGIPELFRTRIFGKFAQADGSDARQKGGTGLGLNITKAIVERLGGQISFITEIDHGTTFYVDLPECCDQ